MEQGAIKSYYSSKIEKMCYKLKMLNRTKNKIKKWKKINHLDEMA